MAATQSGVYLGRKPSFDRKQFNKVRAMLDEGLASISQIALSAGLSRQTVYRIRDKAAVANECLWRGKTDDPPSHQRGFTDEVGQSRCSVLARRLAHAAG